MRALPRGLRGSALLFLLALVPRLIFWFEWNRAGLIALPVVDANTFDSEARGLLAGTWPPHEPFWQAPLYSFFLAGVYRVFGESWAAARLVQAILGATTCVLGYLVARRVLARRWALITFGICALYGPLIYYEGQLLRETLSTCLLLTWLLLHFRALTTRKSLWWAASGATLGLAALARENALAAAPLVILWGLFDRRSRRATALPALLLGLGIILSPVTLWNWRREPTLVPLSSSGGVNFYLGNNADSRATLAIRPGRHWLALVDQPRLEAGVTTAAARSSFFFSKALRWIAHDPLGFAGNTMYKTAGFFSAHEIRRNQGIYEAREGSVVLRLLLWKAGPFGFPFGIVGPLAIVGVILAIGARGGIGGRDRIGQVSRPNSIWASREPESGDRELLFLILLTASHILAIILFFPSARYRAPLAPFLALLASTGIAILFRLVRERPGPPSIGSSLRLPAALLILAGAVILVDGGWVREREDPADQSFLRATALAQAGRTDEAIGELGRATTLNPRHEEAWSTLAALHGRAGRLDESMRAARTALAIDSTDAQAWVDVGTNLLASGDAGAAEPILRRAVSLDPALPEAWLNLGSVQLAQGDASAAEASFGHALTLHPGLVEARRNLSQLLARSGRFDQGRVLLLEGIRTAPDDALLWFALGNLEGRAGRWSEAEKTLTRCLQLMPQNADAWNNLGLVLAQAGRADEARRAFDRALQIAPGHPQAAANRRRFGG
jgi:Flp pilus assembly protein TadD/4-amino-4-deoxy-L-arabinose transferase-like glycosyltransferase